MARKRMVQAINEGIAEEMARDPSIIVMGEDVHISPVGDTRNLIDRFGPERVLTTPISETVMTGMAVGAAATGLRVICHLFYGNFIYTGFDAIAFDLLYLTGFSAVAMTAATRLFKRTL